MNFSENLKKLRNNKGITQEQLAKELNVTKTTVANWEQDVKRPSYENLEQLTTILNCDYNDLLNDLEKKQRSNTYDKPTN